MAIVINGSGTVTGLSVGGLPDGTVDADTLASGAVNSVTGNLTVSGDITGGNNGSIFLLDNAGQKSGQIQTDSSAANALQIDADPDNSNADSYIGFRVDNSEKMRIDSIGAVTMPNQPAFLAELSTVQHNIALNTAVKMLFSTERFDQNSDFNTSTQTFTAPVTGKYQLNTYLRLQNVDTGSGYYHIYLITSNRTYFDIIQPVFTADVTYMNMTVNVLADMDANDTAIVYLYQSGGTAQTDIGYSNDSHFSGYLVC
jgi:hypothetical protein